MRIWDTVMLRDEVDMLKCRLTEMDGTPVYRHVVVESTVDHHGRAKPLVFLENKEEFAPWLDRIVYIVADDLPGASDDCARAARAWYDFAAARHPDSDPAHWVRENMQREHVANGLVDAAPEDIILHSDVDEIIAPAGMQYLAAGILHGVKFRQRCAVFAVDWELPWPWDGPVAVRNAEITIRSGIVGSFFSLRNTGFPVVSTGGGWHLSWMGGSEAIRAKMEATPHNEMGTYISRGLAEGQFYERGIFWGHGQGDTQLLAVDVDETWPRWVFERKCPDSWFRPREEA